MIEKINEQTIYTKYWELDVCNVLQSWAWGEVKAAEGWEVLRYALRFGVNESAVQVQVKKVPLLPYKFGYIPKLNSKVYELLIQNEKELIEEFKSLNIAFVIVEFEKNTISKYEGESFVEYNNHIQPQQTNLINLRKTEEEIFMQMDGNYRRNIKKAERSNLVVEFFEEGEKPLKDFYSILEQIFSNTKLLERSESYYQNLWAKLSKPNGNLAFIATARANGELVGSYLLVKDNVGCYELYGGVNKQGRNLEAGYKLKWEAMKYAKSLGLSFYDHWGVAKILPDNTFDKADELYKISLFKKGFGGENVIFPKAKALLINEVVFHYFKSLQAVNKTKTKIKKLIKF